MRKEPVVPTSVHPREFTYLGLDVHKLSISAAVLRPGQHHAPVEKITNDEESVRRFIGRVRDSGALVACYEAGPTGYELARLLTRLGVTCDVIAPSLIPERAGDRVKTDRREAQKLALLHRAGQLTAIRVPSPQEEDYYLASGEAAGVWVGAGVGLLGLGGRWRRMICWRSSPAAPLRGSRGLGRGGGHRGSI